MSDSDEWMERYYTEQKRLGVMEERNKIAQEKVRNDEANARANRDMHYQLSVQKEKERTQREQLKAEQEEKERQALALLTTQKASIEAQNNLELADKRFQQEVALRQNSFEFDTKNKYADFYYTNQLKTMEHNHDLQRQWKEQEQSRFIQARDIESQHTMQANELTYRLKTQEEDHEQAKFIQAQDIESQHLMQANELNYRIKAQEEEIEKAKFLQAKEIEKQYKMQDSQNNYELEKQYQDHEQAKYLQATAYNQELVLKEEERRNYYTNAEVDTKQYITRSQRDEEAYRERAIVDINSYYTKTAMDLEANKQRSEVDRDKRVNEAFCYHYERTVDAKLKVWIMEQELRIFGRKASDEEIREYVKKNRDKWDKEI